MQKSWDCLHKVKQLTIHLLGLLSKVAWLTNNKRFEPHVRAYGSWKQKGTHPFGSRALEVNLGSVLDHKVTCHDMVNTIVCISKM